MPRFSIELAKPSDDEGLRQLATLRPIGTRAEVVLRREPSYLQGVRVHGPFNQVGVVRDTQTGLIVGCAARSVRSAYVNGTAANLGYLSGLWLEPAYRNGTLLARGYRAFHQLHRDKRALLYLATIDEEDVEVRDLLTSGRAGLPQYEDWGRYYALAIRRGRRMRSLTGAVQVVRGTKKRMPGVEDCLVRNGRRRQFYPCYLSHEIETGAPHLRDLRVEDFYVALREGRVVGVAARWDQSRYKQLIVSGYRRPLSTVRPLLNVFSRMRGLAPLPAPGSELKSLFVSCVAVDDDDPAVFAVLLREIYNDAVAGGYACLLAGFHDQDPLLSVAAGYRHFAHRSRLYVVCWEDGVAYRDSLDGRVPYLELAAT